MQHCVNCVCKHVAMCVCVDVAIYVHVHVYVSICLPSQCLALTSVIIYYGSSVSDQSLL